MPKTELRIVCAWCDEYIKTVDGKGQTGTSHGVCKECAEKMEREYCDESKQTLQL